MTPKKKKIEYESFAVNVEAVLPSYTLSLGDGRLRKGLYNEYLHLSLKGTLAYPKRFSGVPIEMTFLGDRELQVELTEPQEGGRTPLCVGQITKRGSTAAYLGSLPNDMVFGLESAMVRVISPR